MKAYYTEYLRQLHAALDGLDLSAAERVEETLREAILKGRRIFVLGNGGSAAAAKHWACDLQKGVGLETGVYPKCVSLADQLSTFTAIGNDLSYAQVFRQQLAAWMEPGDVVLLLSVSGSSANLLEAAAYARENGGVVVGILGDYQGEAAALSDVALIVPSRNYGVVEDIHVVLDHMIAQSLTAVLKDGPRNGGAR